MSKCSIAHPKIALWRNISSGHSQNLGGMFLRYWLCTPFNKKLAEQPLLKARNLRQNLKMDGGSFGCGQSGELDHYEEAALERERERKDEMQR